MLNCYFLIVVYSLHEIIEFESEQKEIKSNLAMNEAVEVDEEEYNDPEKGYQTMSSRRSSSSVKSLSPSKFQGPSRGIHD
jgi:hypothetical protein